jgi:hypothetical protein
MIRLIAILAFGWPVIGLGVSLWQDPPWRAYTFDELARQECELSPNWRARGAAPADAQCYAAAMRGYRDQLELTLLQRQRERARDL